MKTVSKVRIDKWLWAVRLFKTRTKASDACTAGKVKIEGKSVKPSRNLAIGEVVQFKRGVNVKVYKVEQLIEKRVGADLAKECYEDLSPPEVKEDKLYSAFYDYPTRDKGEGRPTKRDRRDMDRFRGK